MANSTNNDYAQSVDYLVSTMNKSEPPFDTQAYQNYKAQVDKQREHISEVGITNALYELGYKIDTLCSQLIQLCDKILEDDSPTKSS